MAKRIHQTTIKEWEAAFPTEDACVDYLVAHRWSDGRIICPRCGAEVTHPVSTISYRRQCYACAPDSGYRFSHIAGTVFENTNKRLRDWFRVLHMMLAKSHPAPGHEQPAAQAKFDVFLHEFNTERPHEALAMKCPADLYKPSTRIYRGLPELSYPFHDKEILVTACGRIGLHRKKINLSTVFADQTVGIKEIDDGVRLVSFMHDDLGYFDLEQRTLQPIDNPFGPRLSPLS